MKEPQIGIDICRPVSKIIASVALVKSRGNLVVASVHNPTLCYFHVADELAISKCVEQEEVINL